MNDSVSNLEASEQASVLDAVPPEFGLVDVIEAFTAMRHEWRGQAKDSRAFSESVQTAVANIQKLEAKLVAQTASSSTDEARRLAELLADTDNHLTRSVEAATHSEAQRVHREASDSIAIQRHFDGMNAVARWFARPLLTFVIEQYRTKEQVTPNPTIEGLHLVLARLRRAMKEHQIERIDSLGCPFDAETMNAIGTVESPDQAAGHVAEQISPGYLWRGSLLRFADVRVAT